MRNHSISDGKKLQKLNTGKTDLESLLCSLWNLGTTSHIFQVPSSWEMGEHRFISRTAAKSNQPVSNILWIYSLFVK